MTGAEELSTIRTEDRTLDLRELLTRALGADAAPAEAHRLPIHHLCDDSRQVRTGSLFVAIGGTQKDGASFAGEAAARGAAAIVSDREITLPDAGTRARESSLPIIVKVPDARHALAKLSAAFFGLDRIQADGGLEVIGVTGTNGKTTVSYMTRSILQAEHRRVALLGTIEYDLVGRRMRAELTTPGPIELSRHLIEAHEAGARHAVMEVSSHGLDQHRTDGVTFSTAIFTNFTQDHLDYHGTSEAYLRAKRRLFDGLSSDAVAVVNADEPACEQIVEHCRARVVRYRMNEPSDVSGRIVQVDGTGGRFVLEHRGEEFEIRTRLAGRHNTVNALAAATAGLAMGLDASSIQRGIADLAFVPGRLQRLDTGALGFNVFVDYAHTDDALRNVLRAARPLTRGKLWCVFGCGGDRDRLKRPLMARAVAQRADAFILTSDNPRTEDPLAIIAEAEQDLLPEDRQRALTVPDRAEAIAEAVRRLSPGDTLVIAGKGHEDYQILGTRKVHFDDVEVAREAIQRREAGVGCAP